MKIKIDTPYIKLDSLLKLANLAGSGGEAKVVIQEGLVKVDGETERRRGRKITAGAAVFYNGEEKNVC